MSTLPYCLLCRSLVGVDELLESWPIQYRVSCRGPACRFTAVVTQSEWRRGARRLQRHRARGTVHRPLPPPSDADFRDHAEAGSFSN